MLEKLFEKDNANASAGGACWHLATGAPRGGQELCIWRPASADSSVCIHALDEGSHRLATPSGSQHDEVSVPFLFHFKVVHLGALVLSLAICPLLNLATWLSARAAQRIKQIARTSIGC